MSGAQRRVQSPAQRTQLQLAIHLQRAVPVVMHLRPDDTALRLGLQLQIAERHDAIAKVQGRMLPVRLRLQLQRPAALQHGVGGTRLQCSPRRAKYRVHRQVQPRQLGMQTQVMQVDASIRQTLDGSGEGQLRTIELQLRARLPEQQPARQLPLQAAPSLPLGTCHRCRLAIPHRAMHLLQAHAMQMRLEPGQYPARRQEPQQRRHEKAQHGQADQAISQ